MFLRERLTEALTWMELFSPTIAIAKGAQCWDKVFATNFFSARLAAEKQAQAGAAGVLASGLFRQQGADPAVQAAVRKEGGGRYA